MAKQASTKTGTTKKTTPYYSLVEARAKAREKIIKGLAKQKNAIHIKDYNK